MYLLHKFVYLLLSKETQYNNMKRARLIIIVFASCLIPVTTFAESDWWQKGADLLKSLGDTKQTDKPELSRVLATGDIEKAFKEALQIGSENVVNQLSTVNGFYKDPSIRIPLPKKLKPVKKTLYKLGMEKDVDRFEKKLNRAAEAAVPKAKALFLKSISAMTFQDVMGIYEGPKDSATKYFEKKMSPSLRKEMRPIVESSLSEVGAIKAFKKVMKSYNKLPYAPEVKADITGYVIQKGMDGVFFYLAKEEAAIRDNPEKRTTELLKQVFGSQ